MNSNYYGYALGQCFTVPTKADKGVNASLPTREGYVNWRLPLQVLSPFEKWSNKNHMHGSPGAGIDFELYTVGISLQLASIFLSSFDTIVEN